MAGTRLKDVAERAGVSIKTVSNVVRGNARVAEPTRRRVLSAIEEPPSSTLPASTTCPSS
jgi:DNA-binding LacI/PurR family transcriptional regulator